MLSFRRTPSARGRTSRLGGSTASPPVHTFNPPCKNLKFLGSFHSSLYYDRDNIRLTESWGVSGGRTPELRPPPPSFRFTPHPGPSVFLLAGAAPPDSLSTLRVSPLLSLCRSFLLPGPSKLPVSLPRSLHRDQVHSGCLSRFPSRHRVR